MKYRVSQATKPSLLLLVSMGMLSYSPFLHADELDYLSTNSDSGSANIMFALDSSSSLLWSYINMSLVNPAFFPGDEGAAKVLGHQAFFSGQLQNTDIIPDTLNLSYDEKQCIIDNDELSEGNYSFCPEFVPRWYVRELDIIRAIVRDIIPLLKGTNVGFMRTARNSQGNQEWRDLGSSDSINPRTLNDNGYAGDNGSYVISAMQPVTTNADALAVAAKLDSNFVIADMYGGGHFSPMSESLYEAYTYFTGGKSPWTKTEAAGWQPEHVALIDGAAYKGGSTNSPYESLLSECTPNHVIMVTDGAPTYDWQANSYIQALTGASVTATTASEDTLPEHTMLDEFAGYLANTDLDTSLAGDQTITTHFVSTWASDESKALIETATAKSGGFHYELTSVTELYKALEDLIAQIKEGSAPAIGYQVLASNKTGNPFEPNSEAYVSVWERSSGRWSGNLKKFDLNADGALVGSKGKEFISGDAINPDTQDLWSTAANGDATLNGGAAAKLSPVGQNRYTYTGTDTTPNASLSQNAHKLSPANNNLTAAKIGAASDAERTNLLNWASGMDVNDLDGDGDATDVRPSLGDQLNALPVLAHYSDGSNSEPVVFMGSNEGYVHAVDGASGEHMYSFMPQHLLPEMGLLQGFVAEEKKYGVDGKLSIWHLDDNQDFNLRSGGTTDAGEKLMLFFGLRKGGHAFYGLDITSRNAPKLSWFIDNTQPDFTRLGETWAKPGFASIKTTSGDIANAVILSGGFDPDLATNTANTPHLGNSLYIIDAETGKPYWTISNSGATENIAAMKYSIVSKPISLDLNRDGLTETIIFNDVRGQVFRCDIIDQNTGVSFECNLLAQSQADGEDLWFLGGVDVAVLVDDTTGERKLALSLTSGNRLDPTNPSEQNRLVVFYDKASPAQASPTSVIDTTSTAKMKLSDLFDASTSGAPATSAQGWYFNFGTAGEKSFSQTLIFDSKIFFSTYSPTTGGGSGDACAAVDIGNATVYGLDMLTGMGVEGTSQSGNTKGEIWTGPARGLPETPYLVTKIVGSKMEASLNLGVDQTEKTIEVQPLTRSYWFQKEE